ncbi:uncharacterized protein LOC126474793 [Schistocerca serialis cubense]|uniref:uncharacterized protein LOC126474793 n=1 Tax=Schistocerca serialis cubense TaxID=2023355 RepID=UPI00214F4754|nr:uncharacterized protein LOC126474793 [Schistocerca serialis cubense]
MAPKYGRDLKAMGIRNWRRKALDRDEWWQVTKKARFYKDWFSDYSAMKQKQKFEKLAVTVKKEDATVAPKRVVVNLLSEVLDEAAVSVLCKGLNFATTPKRIPVEEILSAVEASLICLPKVRAEEVRQDVSRVLRKSKLRKATYRRRKGNLLLNS